MSFDADITDLRDEHDECRFEIERLNAELERVRAVLQEVAEDKPAVWDLIYSGATECDQCKDFSDAIKSALASPAAEPVIEYRCHDCGELTNPPGLYKFYVGCKCGKSTAVTAAAQPAPVDDTARRKQELRASVERGSELAADWEAERSQKPAPATEPAACPRPIAYCSVCEDILTDHNYCLSCQDYPPMAVITQPAPVAQSDVHKLADELYSAGYSDRQKGRDYDPRGCNEWQAVVDAIAQSQEGEQ